MVNMTPRADEFSNWNVWQEWRESFPTETGWIGNYRRNDMIVNVLSLSKT